MFSHDLSRGESHLLHYSLKRIPDIVQIAQVLKPTFIRLLAPQFEAASEQRMMRALAGAPWLIGMYRSAIDEIHDAGFRCTIENETGRCIIGSPEEAILLFEAIDRPGAVTFTWDIQNMWEVGTYPSMDSYDILKPIIGYVHFKGGRSEGPRGRLAWRSSLGDASWPVADIAKRVACDGASPVVCINPSHGASQTGVCDDYTVADIRYLRAVMEEAK
jgi:hypothetical protein